MCDAESSQGWEGLLIFPRRDLKDEWVWTTKGIRAEFQRPAVRGQDLWEGEGPKGGCMMRKTVRSPLENSASGGRLGLDPKNDEKGLWRF